MLSADAWLTDQVIVARAPVMMLNAIFWRRRAPARRRSSGNYQTWSPSGHRCRTESVALQQGQPLPARDGRGDLASVQALVRTLASYVRRQRHHDLGALDLERQHAEVEQCVGNRCMKPLFTKPRAGTTLGG